MIVVAIIGLMAAFTLPALAQPYQTGSPNFYQDDTNAFTLTLTNGQGSLLAGKKLTLRQEHGLSLFVTVISSNPLAGNGKIGLDVTSDNTSYTTTQPLAFTFPNANYSNGVAQAAGVLTTNVYWTNFPPAVLNNVRGVQATLATNTLVGGGPTTNSVQYKLRYSYSISPP